MINIIMTTFKLTEININVKTRKIAPLLKVLNFTESSTD